MSTQPDPADWIGKQERRQDVVAPDTVARMAATLGVETPAQHLPPLWHWIFHLDAPPAGSLGRDGHAKTGEFLPPMPLPRRMWAGGDVRFHRVIPLGAEVEKTSTITEVTPKSGRTGPLYFVTVTHHLHVDGALAVEEDHNLVYREDPAPGSAAPKPPEAPQDAEERFEVQATTTLLFRYSALTFNGHRIHYDQSYARDVEGYPDVVVHGPLLATYLASAGARHGAMTRFRYRAISPICGAGPITIASRPEGAGRTLWAASQTGALAMTAQADYAT